MIAAVVPVKDLSGSKSRLDDGHRGDIEALALAMMADVLDALLHTRGVDRVAVVTPDEAVARAARDAGAEALRLDVPGLNASIEAAAATLARGVDDGVLVVLGDVAAASAADLSRLVAAAGPPDGPRVALAPSRDGGTSALLRIPRDAIPARFGPDSAKRHREAAERAGVRFQEIALPSLAIDVDVADDAREILACETLGARTRTLLERVGNAR